VIGKPSPHTKKQMKSSGPVLLLVWSALLLSACSRDGAATNPGAGDAEDQPAVRVAEVVERKMTRSLELSGNILQSRKAALSPTVPGTIRQVHKREGDLVKKGEILVELDPRDFQLGVQQASAALSAARAGLAAAKTGLDGIEVQHQRFVDLRKENAVTKAEFEKIDTGYKVAQSQHEAAAAQARLAQVGLNAARKKLADTVARAPFDGVVTQRLLDPGEVVRMMPPSIVLVIMDIDPVNAEGQVAERDLGAIRERALVQVMVDALPGRHFAGEVEVVVPFVDPGTRTAKVRVVIDNPEHELKPGMSATIRIDLAEQMLVLVPREAMTSPPIDGKGSVFSVDGEQRIHLREIVVDQSQQGPEVVVLSGLRPGERVVVAGAGGLSDGQQIRLSGKLPKSAADAAPTSPASTDAPPGEPPPPPAAAQSAEAVRQAAEPGR